VVHRRSVILVDADSVIRRLVVCRPGHPRLIEVDEHILAGSSDCIEADVHDLVGFDDSAWDE
jgi:hypothetical protein